MKKLILIFLFSSVVFILGAQEQIVKQGLTRFPARHKDSFGQLRTALVGVTTWTERQIRNTGIVAPHIADGDVFSFNVQLNHDERLSDTITDGFHIHAVPIAATATTDTIVIIWSYGVYRFGDVIPDVLPNSGTTRIPLQASQQYKHLYFDIIDPMTLPKDNTYSSFILIKCTRATDVYAGEFALLGADVHYITDRLGSKEEGTE